MQLISTTRENLMTHVPPMKTPTNLTKSMKSMASLTKKIMKRTEPKVYRKDIHLIMEAIRLGIIWWDFQNLDFNNKTLFGLK